MINGVSISDLPGMAAPRKFPAIRALYDLHRLDYAHAKQTKKELKAHKFKAFKFFALSRG